MQKPEPNNRWCGFAAPACNDFTIRPVRFSVAVSALYLVLLISLLTPTPGIAVPLIPDKDITVVNKQADEPLWKQQWDSARDFFQEQRYAEAITAYQAVLKQKPHAEEVKWELCKVYIAIEDYAQASVLLEGLLEADEKRIDYMISAGQIAFLENKMDHAVEHYGQAFEQDPGGTYADEALWGLIRSLKAQGKGGVALPLMDQLYQRGGVNPELLLDLARLNRAVEALDKSSYYYAELIKKYRVEPAILYEAADIFEKRGQLDLSATLWKQYLEKKPDYLPYQAKLADYYLDKKETVQALPHLLILIDNEFDLKNNLLRVAKIYLYNLGRADKSLYYFEQYQQRFPDQEDVSYEIANLQLILANDLLSIIENSGVWMLWRDLARVTPDRIGIYRAMAELLEELGREAELIEVLQIIIVHEPDDFESLFKLSSLYLKQHSYDACLLFLDNTKDRKDLPALFHLYKALCERGGGNDIGALAAYEEYLKMQPDADVQADALRLAGDTGMIDSLDRLYARGRLQTDDRGDFASSIEKIYLDALIDNRLYTKAERMLEAQAGNYPEISLSQVLIAVERAGILFLQGRVFEAERLLRMTLRSHPDSAAVVVKLADISLQKKDITAALAWLRLAEELSKNPGQNRFAEQLKSSLFYQQLHYEKLSGSWNSARQKAEDYLKSKMAAQSFIAEDEDILIFLAIYYFETADYEKSIELLDYYQKIFRASQRIPLLSGLILQEQTAIHGTGDNSEQTRREGSKDLSLEKQASLSEQLNLLELLTQLNREDRAVQLLADVASFYPDSIRAQVLTAETSAALLDYDNAWDIYHSLSFAFTDETYFQDRLYSIAYLKGEFTDIIETFAADEQRSRGVAEERGHQEQMNRIIDEIFLARALWADYHWDDALKSYDKAYFQLKDIISNSMVKLEVLPEYKKVISRSFLGDLLFTPDDEEILDIFMAPPYFAQHRRGQAALLSSTIYDTYRWYKIIRIERDAKSALNAREFYQAEKDYRELIDVDKDAGEDSYIDLATVYSRLGRNREEFELLEKIKELNLDYPELEAATERNVRQRKPYLALDALYREEDGRNGYIDIKQLYAGGKISLTPSLLTLSDEASLIYARNEYGNSNHSTLAKSNYVMGQYTAEFNDQFNFSAAVGFEDFDTDGKSFLRYNVNLHAQLDNAMGIYAGIKQAPVDDTIASLEDGTYRRDVDAGLSLEFLPRLFVGFDISVMNYNDENDGQLFNLWSAYRLFGERSSFDLSYKYDKFENTIANPDIPVWTIIPGDDKPNYWSPGNFWRHFVSAEYKLELWPTGWLQSGTSSVSGLYGIGYEKGANLIQALEVNILLEISPKFLVKGTLASEWSDDYDYQKAFVSLAYRW